MIKSQKEILNDLSPILPDLRDVFANAFNDYKKDFLLTCIATRSEKRSVAVNVSDAIWEYLKQRFSGREMENIYLRNEKGARFLQYHDYIIRIKKINKQGIASNVITKNSENFFMPLFDCSLFNNEQLVDSKAINLTLGYKADDSRTIFSFPFLVAPLTRKEVAWVVNLSQLNQDIKISNFPQIRVTEENELKPRKVKPKKKNDTNDESLENTN
jgi:hypothetical protein